MDEDRFKSGFDGHAIRPVYGKEGREGLTIERHETLGEATAKRPVDVVVCGAGCVKAPIIIHVDPENSRKERQGKRQKMAR